MTKQFMYVVLLDNKEHIDFWSEKDIAELGSYLSDRIPTEWIYDGHHIIPVRKISAIRKSALND